MKPNFYTETATVLNADADFRSLLKPSALLRYVEQVSADHARAFGMDDKFFQDHNVAFLVGKQALQFVRVPRRTEALTLTTRAEHSRRGAIKRITTVTDAAGKLVATVDCRWILVDLTGGHIMREPDWTVENFWNETVEGELSLHTHRCKELTSAGERRASYSLCDLNGHINNALYLDIACDAIPLEVWRTRELKFFSIKYHREVPMGEKMAVFYAPVEQGWYVVGRREEHMAFECYLEFADEAAQKA